MAKTPTVFIAGEAGTTACRSRGGWRTRMSRCVDPPPST